MVMFAYLFLTNTGGLFWVVLEVVWRMMSPSHWLAGSWKSVAQLPPELPPTPVGYGMEMLWLATLLGMLVGVLLLVLLKPRLVRTRVTRRVVEREGEPVEEFIFEAMQPGSNFFSSPIPAFQAKLYVKVDGVWYRSGGVSRCQYGLITAHHVLAEAEAIKIVRGNDMMELTPDQFTHLEELGDVALAKDVHPLFLKQAKLAATGSTVGAGTMVMLHNGEQASMGPLKADRGSFGIVRYCGSSVKGFSGSPYYMGNVLYGIHVGSMGTNYGYDVGYLKLCNRLEDSGDRIADEIAQGFEHEVKPSPYDPDEVFVKIKGYYHVMDSDVYYEAKAGKRRVQESAPRAPAVDFSDPENFDRPAAPLGVAGPNVLPDGVAKDISLLTTNETPDQFQKLGCPSGTVPQESTPAPSDKASSITSEFILESALKLPVRDLRAVATALAKELRGESVVLKDSIPKATEPPSTASRSRKRSKKSPPRSSTTTSPPGASKPQN